MFPFVYVPNDISTDEMTVLSELIINQKSTAGPKIATVKNVMFVVSDLKYTNPLIHSKRYAVARKAEEFPSLLELQLETKTLPDIFNILDMPKDSVSLLK